jgi:plasmid stabilization system protein ParE
LTRKIEFSPQADRQIDVALQWWTKNRPGAPHLLTLELDRALESLQDHPRIGEKIRVRRSGAIRKLVLQRSRYDLYYLIQGDTIQILALWHQSRGKLPRL